MRKIRTMRQVWDESGGARKGREKPGLAGAIIRIQSACESHNGANATRETDAAVPRQGLHPWIFRRVAERQAKKVRGRVKAVVVPKAEIKKRRGAEEFVVLYSLPHVAKESIEVELKGDLLRVTAHGLDPLRKGPFEVLSEALLPKILLRPRLEHSYAGEVLEVSIRAQHPAPPVRAASGQHGHLAHVHGRDARATRLSCKDNEGSGDEQNS